MASNRASLYDALRIHRDAPLDVIKRAYRKAARDHHPDHGGDREKFALVILARDVLTDEERRAKYDRTGEIDDVGPDQRESDAMQLAMQAINMVIGQNMGRGVNIETVDLIAYAVKGLKSEIAKMKDQERAAKDNAKQIRKLAKRFKAKKGQPNRIGPMMEAQARQQDDAGVAAVKMLEPTERAIALLGAHTFDVAEQDPYAARPTPPSFFAAT